MKRILAPLLLAATALHAGAGHAAGFQAGSTSIGPDGALSADNVIEAYGCHGPNLSPEVHWSGAPAGTKSFAVTVHDVDAPTDSGWWHWAVVDIPATTASLAQNAGAAGASPGGGSGYPNGARHANYDGPCPPAGPAHQYHIAVYAMPGAHADIPPDTGPRGVAVWLKSHALASAEIVPVFGKK